MQVLVATAKGLIVYSLAPNNSPKLIGTHFPGFNITMVYEDPSNGRWWAGVAHKHWGQKLHYTDDQGKSWLEVRMPSFNGACFPDGSLAKIRQLWCMSGSADKGVLWLGTDPGGLFRSDDNGEHFTLVSTLWEHPSRAEGHWFGAGSDYPFIHSIILNNQNPDHLYVGVSCAGVFESVNGGESWSARNRGLRAAYLPNPNVEVGHDPHILRINPFKPEILWQQNHCGIYYSLNGGGEWKSASNEDTIPHYGFAMVTDDDPSCAWVIPVQSDEQRIAPERRLRVYRSYDYGAHWIDDSKGLPLHDVFDIVLRQAFEKKGESMVFGTTNGNLYCRSNFSLEWTLINAHLTKVNSVIICN